MATARERKKWARELAEHWRDRPRPEYCEVRFQGCFGTYGLAPAHSRKRRKIESKAQFFEVVAACLFCHRQMDEKMSHDEMESTVQRIIKQRESQHAAH
jgi:hypothetical protein